MTYELLRRATTLTQTPWKIFMFLSSLIILVLRSTFYFCSLLIKLSFASLLGCLCPTSFGLAHLKGINFLYTRLLTFNLYFSCYCICGFLFLSPTHAVVNYLDLYQWYTACSTTNNNIFIIYLFSFRVLSSCFLSWCTLIITYSCCYVNT